MRKLPQAPLGARAPKLLAPPTTILTVCGDGGAGIRLGETRHLRSPFGAVVGTILLVCACSAVGSSLSSLVDAIHYSARFRKWWSRMLWCYKVWPHPHFWRIDWLSERMKERSKTQPWWKHGWKDGRSAWIGAWTHESMWCFVMLHTLCRAVLCYGMLCH